MNLKVMSAAALFLSAAAVGGMSSAASAADLGGTCCSDLEERVAELEATTARKGNRKVSVEVYGFVTTGIMSFRTDGGSDTFITENANGSSRFGFKGSAKISPTLSAGFQIEVGVVSASSNSVSQKDDDGGQAGDGTLGLRQANWYLDHKSLGRVTVGRISSAMDGIQEIDLAGTGIVSLPGINVGGGLFINGVAGKTWGDVMQGFDGDRVNGIRYDTPTWNGFQLSTSFSENDRTDVTLRYAGEFAGFRIAGGIGYGIGSDNSDEALGSGAPGFNEVEFISGSLSVLHVKSGLFATGFAGQRSFDYAGAVQDYDSTNWGVRAGVAKNWTGLGNTVVFGEYNFFDNVKNNGKEAEVWGVGVIQNIDAAAMELFLSYKNYSTNVPSDHDADIVFGGARVKF
jgi:predicted porin